MKLKSFLMVAGLIGLLSACGINDLEDRLNKVENSLGTNEPINVDFSTTNFDDAVIAKKTSYLFKSTGWYTQYFTDNGDGTYYIYVERFSDVDWNEGAWAEFNYNPTTKEVIDQSAGVYFRSQTGNWINPNFYETDGCTVDITVKSFNADNGSINFVIDATSDGTFINNEFEGHAMTYTMNFAGKLEEFIN